MKFTARIVRMQLARAVLTLAILVVGGTVGYMLIEGWSLVDAA